MTNNKKISEIYKETKTAIKKLRPNMELKERNKIYDTILKNREYLGITFNPYVMNEERIKELNIDIIDNIEMASRNTQLLKLRKLKRKIEEEPSFIQQFNFRQ